MAYTPPDYAAFIARFPIFSDIAQYPQAVVEACLLEATNTIDTSWIEADYAPAINYLAAHLLATDNSGEGEEVELGAPGGIASESFAGMSVSYASGNAAAGSAAASSYGDTSYGRRYYDLLRKNKPPVVVA